MVVGESIYVAFAVSVLRSALMIGGGWLVSRGMADDTLMREVAAGLAVIIVTQAWAFWRLHKRMLYERWLALVGIEADQTTAPEVVRAEARARARDGWVPPADGTR